MMNKIFPFILTILFVTVSCKDSKKSEYSTSDKADSQEIVTTEEHPGKKIMETECYICHDATTPEESRIAPPMIAIKTRYTIANTSKEEFVEQMWDFVSDPTEEKAVMYGALSKFGVMPYQAFPEEKIKLIAEYMYDNEIAKPEWFEEHYRKEHGEGQGQGMGRRKGQGKQQRIGQNKTSANYSDIGLKYALSTKAQLGKNLIRALDKKGPDGAVEFCNIEAMKLTDSISVMHNAIIKRVSDKPRNPLNKANTKELGHIAAFKTMLKAGADIEPILEEINGDVNFYYPITTNTMCLQCHGTSKEQISTSTLETLRRLYPKDKAIGYDVGQVRGIWSINFAKNSIE
ncbi:DUF3365 domain-containing protein [Maribacter sp. HTCC2170]|uniref:Tll0287-like domain-containing protein n=1 Tax=Maribacter sp. (strain HTCC2170 / KCCM 42371) TaxID=313603 RepID=UPI00006B48CC|nr:DUF3365 domain-containing protein [Maribacter sp. HTCC2170]EAR01843.1 hypothetical protein FB2170_14983 [Maribacter sp. HTCC2170]